MRFEEAIKIILKHEGGYVNHPKDPGGETNFGITKRFYPDLVISKLTKEEATRIYKRDYWERMKIDELYPEKAKLLVFDCAVNQGPKRAKDLWALADKEQLVQDKIKKFANLRLLYYTKLKNWETFGAGWAKRLLDVTLESILSD